MVDLIVNTRFLKVRAEIEYEDDSNKVIEGLFHLIIIKASHV